MAPQLAKPIVKVFHTVRLELAALRQQREMDIADDGGGIETTPKNIQALNQVCAGLQQDILTPHKLEATTRTAMLWYQKLEQTMIILHEI